MLSASCSHCFALRMSKTGIKARAGELAALAQNDIELYDKIHTSFLSCEDSSSSGEDATLNTLVDKAIAQNRKKVPLDVVPKHQLEELINATIKEMTAKKYTPCAYCNRKTPKIKVSANKTIIFYEAFGNKPRLLLTPSKVMDIMRRVWGFGDEQYRLLAVLYDVRESFKPKDEYKMFFIENLVVTPPRFRPLARFSNLSTAHPHTTYYEKIIAATNELFKIAEVEDGGHPLEEHDSGKGTAETMRPKLISFVQDQINSLFNSNDPRLPVSIRGILEKKEGLFRKHMMGKRVNFAGRSVISPDPYLDTNELGVPLHFATHLTFPEIVNKFNVERLAQCVLRGPSEWPGAVMVEDEFGKRIKLDNPEVRASVAKSLLTIAPFAPLNYKVVHRHIISGDYALFNRQPTLHKPSIMGHKIRILSNEKTLRMHYANCSAYNADFDGDEMNMHVPQGLLQKSEIASIANADNQYLVPKDGSPLRGLIQDWIDTGVYLTKRDTFFSHRQFQQLLYSCLFNVRTDIPIVTPPPAVVKPKELWTGKQLVTTIMNHISHGLPSLSYESKGKVPGTLWGRGGTGGVSDKPDEMARVWTGAGDGVVVMVENTLVCGVLDKAQLGASAFGLIHCCHELYGARAAGQMLSLIGRLCVQYLQMRGFTCGIDDILITKEHEAQRTRLLEEADKKTIEATYKFVGKSLDTEPDAYRKEYSLIRQSAARGTKLDNAVKSAVSPISSQIIDSCLPDGMVKSFPVNCFSMMTQSGAKGSVVNFSQVSCLLSQIELEGRRVPLTCRGKALPSFREYDPSARAGGYVMGRFLTGIPPQEYFFHCMAGREGLIDTAVKTSRSGYLQRCLMKGLEPLSIAYDYTVRDSDGSIVQFNYGEDSLDVQKTGFLYAFDFWARNFGALRHSQEGRYDEKELEAIVRKMERKTREAEADPSRRSPIIGEYFASEAPGVTSEKFFDQLNEFVERDASGVFRSGAVPAAEFKALMYMKYSRSLSNPGEAVGILAAQSLGEPSTQMTLNTFHLAGRGDVNVTMGIPRLRELLMFAKKDIETPSMVLRVKQNTQEAANTAARFLERVLLSDIVKNICITETVEKRADGVRMRVAKIRLELLSNAEEVLSTHGLLREIPGTKKTYFDVKVDQLQGDIRFQIKKVLRLGDNAKVIVSDVKGGDEDVGRVDGDGAEDEGERERAARRPKGKKGSKATEDDDTTTAKKRGQREERGLYEGPDEEDAEKSDAEDDSGMSDSDAEDGDRKASKAGGGKKGASGKKEDKPKEAGESVDVSGGKADFESIEFSVGIRVGVKLMLGRLVEECTDNCVLCECPGIKKCFVSEDKGQYVITTEGVNLVDIAKISDYIDMDTVKTNDIHAVKDHFGIEACTQTIKDEVGGVFGVYGIKIDKRHLSLVSDYMTFEGGIRPFNRTGMKLSTSPVLQMSYESTFLYLSNAVLHGLHDNMRTPAASIVFGEPMKFGTGAFELRMIMDSAAADEELKHEGEHTKAQERTDAEEGDSDANEMEQETHIKSEKQSSTTSDEYSDSDEEEKVVKKEKKVKKGKAVKVKKEKNPIVADVVERE